MANTVALKYLLLDYHIWRQTNSKIQFKLFSHLADLCEDGISLISLITLTTLITLITLMHAVYVLCVYAGPSVSMMSQLSTTPAAFNESYTFGMLSALSALNTALSNGGSYSSPGGGLTGALGSKSHSLMNSQKKYESFRYNIVACLHIGILDYILCLAVDPSLPSEVCGS